jgi:hypothetical protein
VIAFVNTEVPQAASLAAHMQKLVNETSGLKGLVVFVAGPEAKPAISELAEKEKITIPMVFLPKGKDDPALARYKINPEVKTTVLVTKRKRVLTNFVNVGPDQLPQISAEAKKMMASAG